MAGNFISANFLELRKYSYYVISKLYFSISTSFWIFYTLLYFFNHFAKFQHLYLKSCNMGDMIEVMSCLNLKRPLYTTQKGSTVQHSPCLLVTYPTIPWLSGKGSKYARPVHLAFIPTAVPWKEHRQFESPTILPDWELPLLIGAYLTPSRLLASLGYNNRCYTQNFVRVNGCCWWMLFVCWSVIGLQWSILVQTITPSHIAAYDPFPGCYHFGMLFNFFKTSILQTPFGNLESHLFCHKLYIWSLHLPFTFSILYHGRVAKHLNFSCGLHLCNFHLSFSKTTPCLLQATLLGTFVSMHNFAQRIGTSSIFYQVFSSLFLWYFVSSYTIRQNLLLLFGEYGFCMVGYFSFSWWFPKMLQQTINSWHLQQA
jgi:hypothetical protein